MVPWVRRPRGFRGTPPPGPKCLQIPRDLRDLHPLIFNVCFRFVFWSRFWLLPGGFQASFGTFLVSMSSLKIPLISYLFLRPIFNRFFVEVWKAFLIKKCAEIDLLLRLGRILKTLISHR